MTVEPKNRESGKKLSLVSFDVFVVVVQTIDASKDVLGQGVLVVAQGSAVSFGGQNSGDGAEGENGGDKDGQDDADVEGDVLDEIVGRGDVRCWNVPSLVR